MSNLFHSGAQAVRKSSAVILVYLVFVAMLIISIGIGIEDYTTSLRGYAALPTAKANDWVIPLVALIPQVGQIGFGYVFMANTTKRWGLLIALLLHAVDVTTDVMFKRGAGGAAVTLLAFAESEIIYTLGSEVMMITAIGMLMELLPDVLREVGELARKLLDRDDE